MMFEVILLIVNSLIMLLFEIMLFPVIITPYAIFCEFMVTFAFISLLFESTTCIAFA